MSRLDVSVPVAAPTPQRTQGIRPKNGDRLKLDAANLDPGSPQLTYDLAIVGGGIVGNTLAVALQNSGLKVVSIEAQAQSVSITKS